MATLPSDVEQQSYHRMTIRYNKQYHNYLEHLSYKTGLDIVQIIRLLIHLAPKNAEFNNIINQYVRNDRRGILYINDWSNNSNLWKRT